LFRVEGIVAAQGRVDVAPQLFQAGKRGDGGHGDSAISGRYGGVARHGPPPHLSTPPEAESTSAESLKSPVAGVCHDCTCRNASYSAMRVAVARLRRRTPPAGIGMQSARLP